MQKRQFFDTRKPILMRSAASRRKLKLRAMYVALLAAFSATVVMRA